MSDKEKNEKTPEAAKKKGFYIALYSCVGVMLVLAGIIGYYNLSTSPYQAQTETDITADDPAAEVDSRQDFGYSSQNDDYLSPNDRSYNYSRPTSSPAPTPIPKTSPTAQPPASTPPPPANQGTTIVEPEEQEFEIIVNDSPVSQIVIPEDEAVVSMPVDILTEPTVQAQEEEAPKTFTAFTDEDKLEWPIIGDVVMEYSKNRTVYDKTLEQRRTNEALCISAELDEPVKAAAGGRITDIFTTIENGKTVVIDHGNGWITTYSQLSDNVLVAVGDVVETGEVFASVGQPSRFSVLLGEHLSFVVSKDSETQNPIDLFAIK